jgi:hypothetical protein
MHVIEAEYRSHALTAGLIQISSNPLRPNRRLIIVIVLTET